jgi:NAD(P)-dependent dehydrogenase (short-subunit alcohol dehydrogenase family)
MRLKDRVAIIVGAGQSPGEGIGNGRATALTFAREGAKVLPVARRVEQPVAAKTASKGKQTA